MAQFFPLGKLPPEVLKALLNRAPAEDPRVILGPQHGEDAAVIDLGIDQYLVLKTDPITFATDEIGWYAVNVNANDIAVTGGVPTWFMATLLLPAGMTDQALVDRIFDQLVQACQGLNINLVGGHTEITYGIDRPIVTGMMIGLAPRDKLVTTSGALPGDVLIVTKGIPVEATAIIARERGGVLSDRFSPEFLSRCAGYLYDPGISVVRDTQIALSAGRIHAMHDPTEGGLATGLWELAEASGRALEVSPHLAVLPDSLAICQAVGLDPLAALASGALLVAAHPDDAAEICKQLTDGGIPAFQIGRVLKGEALVYLSDGSLLARPARDEIARLYE